jgi:hypothetical protein
MFDNVFEATDHMLEDDEEFDPALILPGGYKLMIGSLLRCLYRYSDSPEDIKEITQSTYMTLFRAETEPDSITKVIEDVIISASMAGIDREIKDLLTEGEQ